MSGISLEKGSSINLTKEAPNLSNTRIRLEWDPIGTVTESKGFFGNIINSLSTAINTDDFDLDAKINVFGQNGKNIDKIYYGKLQNSNHSIIHSGDDLTGEGEGEEIRVDLNKLDESVQRLDIHTDIYNAHSKGQNFGQVSNAKVVLFNDTTNEMICEYKLSNEFANDTSVHFGSLEKVNGEWQFTAVGKGS